jgi:antitoxin component of RelBE/YafQ-DinJ toxin-antitoxin module
MRITFRIDDELLRRARIYAEAKGTTVNDIVRKYITKIAAGEIKPYPPRPMSLPSDSTTHSKPECR